MTASKTPATLVTLPVTQCQVEGADTRELRIADLGPSTSLVQLTEEYFASLGDPRQYGRVVLPALPSAAIPLMAMMAHARGSLSLLIGLQPFRSTTVAGWINISTERHDDARTQRFEALKEERALIAPYVVIDCAPRALNPDQLNQLAEKLGCQAGDIGIVKADPGQVKIDDLGGEEGTRLQNLVYQALKEAGVSLANLQEAQQRVIFNAPPLGVVAAYMGLVLYGAMEVWPKTLRLANVGNNVFVVAEILDIQSTRQWVDTWVAEREASKPRVIVAGDVPEEFREELAILARQHNVEVRA